VPPRIAEPPRTAEPPCTADPPRNAYPPRPTIRLVGMHRTPMTWAIYGVNGAWASFVYLSGPIARILAEDMGVSVSSAGLLGTALAAGIATSSAVAPVAVRRLGRDRTTRGGLVVLAAMMAALALVPPALGGTGGFVAALLLVWIGSIGGGTVLNASTARLSSIHPEHSGQAITEANAAAAWVGVLSPLLLGAALGAGLGWRVGVVVCLVAMLAALAGLALAGRTERRTTGADDRAPAATAVAADEGYEPGAAAAAAQAEGAPADAPPAGHPLPGLFWVAMVALFAAAGTEFAINFWGSALIEEQTGAATASATASMSAVVAGIAVGRTVGSWTTARLGPHTMLLAGFVLALAGFAVLWTATALPLSIAGLFVAGLGLATLFPLVLDRGILLSAGQPDTAMSRSSLVLGFAVGTAPFLLGALGSVMSVRSAMLLVPALIVAGLLGVALSRPRHA
jgi:predicted MFS family arabinose efflux permease